ncbi:MAG: FAD-binding oxidoreductase, partial [Sphingomonadaceae bacterium]|nr:FAD-binding oxidoreductase [Sphingomonadaceae bacterium]
MRECGAMERVDFLVIGAGIAGLSAAARLARHGHTVVCEAEDAPGVHASGRSAAFAHFDMDAPLVRALTAASLSLLEEPGARPHPALFIALQGQEADLARVEAGYREWAPVERLSAAEAQALVPTLKTGPDGIIGGLLDTNGRKLDAHALLEGHRHALLQAGGQVVTNAP